MSPLDGIATYGRWQQSTTPFVACSATHGTCKIYWIFSQRQVTVCLSVCLRYHAVASSRKQARRCSSSFDRAISTLCSITFVCVGYFWFGLARASAVNGVSTGDPNVVDACCVRSRVSFSPCVIAIYRWRASRLRPGWRWLVPNVAMFHVPVVNESLPTVFCLDHIYLSESFDGRMRAMRCDRTFRLFLFVAALDCGSHSHYPRP